MKEILILHILGALASGVLVIESTRRLITNSGKYRYMANCLLVAAGYQTITGFVLLANGGNLTRLCISGLIYGTVIGATEYGLYRRMQVITNK